MSPSLQSDSASLQLTTTPRHSQAQGSPLWAVTRRSSTSLGGSEDYATTMSAWGGPRTLFEKVTLETGRGVQGECAGIRGQREAWETGASPRAGPGSGRASGPGGPPPSRVCVSSTALGKCALSAARLGRSRED